MAIKTQPAAGRIIISADSQFTYPLICDPDTQALGDDTLRGLASGSLTAADVDLPTTASLIIVRPLTPAERDEAEDAAGPQTHLGVMIAGLIEQSASAAPDERTALLTRGRALDDLAPDERAAYQRLLARIGRRSVEIARRGLVAVSLGDVTPEGERVWHREGEAWAAVGGVQDKLLRNRIIGEIAGHVDRLSSLTEEGKA